MKRKILIFILIPVFIIWGFNVYDNIQDFEILKNVEIYVNVLKSIKNNYYTEVDFRQIITKNIKSLTKELDPYTQYYSDSEIEKTRIDNYNILYSSGIEIDSFNNKYYISNIIDSSSAFKENIKIGDELIKIDGFDVLNKKFFEVKQLLFKQPGYYLTLTIKRNSQIYEKKILVSNYKPNPIPVSIKINENVGYIKLTDFTENCSVEFRKSFVNLQKSGIKYLIIDLRNNPGGLLNQAVNIINFFIPKDKIVVVSKGKDENSIEVFKTNQNPIDENIPIVVLINEKSASASEIVAGTLQDYDRAVVVGRNSYGKGLVQRFFDVGYNSMIKITISKYYLPSGRCIQEINYHNFDNTSKRQFLTKNKRVVFEGNGILPDIILNNNLEYEFKFLNSIYFFNYCNILFSRMLNENKTTDVFYFDKNEIEIYLKDYLLNTSEELKNLKSIKLKYPDKTENIDNIINSLILTDTKSILKNEDLMKSKIKFELIRREKGNIFMYKTSFNEDTEIKKAVEILEDNLNYKKILNN